MAERSLVVATKEIEPGLGASALAQWYRGRATIYPWRRGVRDPYQILVCEFMAQQTQASRVAVAFEDWIERFPTVEVLAGAPRADVLRAWQGLGYNRRAIALHETARVIVAQYDGVVPGDTDVLVRFPGVGPYTAAAVASIAFGVAVVALDTNIRRVAARVLRGVEPDELPSSQVHADAQAWLDPADPGAWNQAVMDVGASLCRPRAPRCEACPLSDVCVFRASGRQGRSSVRPQAAFEGSDRQVRGAIVRVLSQRGPLSARQLSDATGHDTLRIQTLVEALSSDGLIEQTPTGELQLKA